MDLAFPLFPIIFLLLWFVLFAAAAGLVAYFDSEEFKKRRQELIAR